MLIKQILSFLIGLIFLSNISQSQVTRQFRRFNTTQPYLNPTVNCSLGQFALEGRFAFLGHLAEAYFRVTSGWVYFEYIFPAYFWVGVGASNQSIPLLNGCLTCFYANNQNVLNCLDQCVGNNVFVVTGEGDPDPINSWHNTEFKFVNTLNNTFDQYRLPEAENKEVIYNEGTSRGEVFGSGYVEYIHGWWYRSWYSSEGDKWNVPINGNQPICWTTVASAFDETNLGQLDVGYYLDKNNTELICVNTSVACTTTFSPTRAPTNNPVPPPSPRPTTAPVVTPIPDVSVNVSDQACQGKI